MDDLISRAAAIAEVRTIGLANHRMIDPIPADIAQKLGIEPKEG